ncbi:DUF6185 family protein [Streptomyces sp. NBC_00091]|uniref:DUF6185 family protein n=1 Tax=Streptomyces sp. NBC_00091 TaxID=2975648 RepID=UPI002259D983|nr:DUF6185 family protein [Streptomyces sp. NBC_00091]MCX5381589.1 DUF6185 family protein [Streptomyces sp. NBC_00091]
MKTRWWFLFLLLIVAVMGWGGAAEAFEADRESCELGSLKARNLTSRLDFDYHDRVYAQVTSNLTFSLSSKEWPLAEDLALSEETVAHQNAMRCLLRWDEDVPRPREWRLRDPLVTVRGDAVAVNYEAIAWVEHDRVFRVGPWRIDFPKNHRKWQVFLRPSRALENINWGQVEVKLNGLEAHNIFPTPSSADSDRLVWSEVKPVNVRVEVDPPWQRSFNVGERWWSLGWAGVATWWVFTSAVIVLAVSWASGKKSSGPPGWRGFKWVLVLWAVLSVTVVLMLRLLILEPKTISPSWRYIVAIAGGLALLLAARPWRRIVSFPTVQESGAEGVQRRQARAVTVTASAVAVFGFLLVVDPQVFHLTVDLTPRRPQAAPGVVGLVLLGLATLWLWLAAMAAWAWCFVRAGEMVRESWSAVWDEKPVRCTLAVGALLAVVEAALIASFWWTSERSWGRPYWLIDPSGTGRDSQRIHFLQEFAFFGLTWVYAYAWLLTGIALIALLHIRVKARPPRIEGKGEGSWVEPTGVNLLLTAAIFALAVGFRQVEFAGSNVLFGIWLLMMIGCLYAVVGVGRRFSVLGRGERFCIRRLSTRRGRRVLLRKAHEYRNLHHKIYSLDRGRAEGGLTREELEKQLDRLHLWLFDGWDEDRPPPPISVLDAALSWGPAPSGDWWENARYAARLAFCFGIPASIALVWLGYLRDSWTQMLTFQDLIGVPQMVAQCLAWQVTWAGAGLALGALWRVLPGGRSPVRALSLTAAYAIPVCVGALVAQITDVELGYVFLHVALMLLVLTLTSIWMDMATFSEERKFWPTRLGLLLSVYQLRGLSTQVAYLLVQLGAVVAVWHTLASSASRPR